MQGTNGTEHPTIHTNRNILSNKLIYTVKFCGNKKEYKQNVTYNTMRLTFLLLFNIKCNHVMLPSSVQYVLYTMIARASV